MIVTVSAHEVPHIVELATQSPDDAFLMTKALLVARNSAKAHQEELLHTYQGPYQIWRAETYTWGDRVASYNDIARITVRASRSSAGEAVFRKRQARVAYEGIMFGLGQIAAGKSIGLPNLDIGLDNLLAINVAYRQLTA